MGARVQITPPEDYLLRRDVCSYGYFLLAPNRWDPASETLSRPTTLPGGRVFFRIAQPSGRAGGRLAVATDRALSRADRAALRGQIVRMLRLDESAAAIAAFHAMDPRWRASGRGRLFRSPTLFEDMVKTITSCNVTWPGTRRMNERLCAVINPAFPTPAQLARRRPASLRGRCGVGYRDVRIVELARRFERGEVDPKALEDPDLPDEELRAALLELPGIGPYAAANIMQTLGRYSRLAVDTEAIRHAREVLGFQGEERSIRRRIERHYAGFGDQRFRSYWLELWTRHERERGAAWTWPAPGEIDAPGASARGRAGVSDRV